jgi:hypothetical protein
VKSKPSLGYILKDTGLRIICSISGTITDIVPGLFAHLGRDAIELLLRYLQKYVEADSPQPPTEPQLSNDSSELLLATAMDIQVGQYDSEGEVLAGLYPWLLLFAGDPNVNNFDAIASKLEQM